MKEFNIDNVIVQFNDFNDNEVTVDMATGAIEYAEKHKDIDIAVISKIIVTKTNKGASFDVEYEDKDQPKIGRIRRITGCDCIAQL